MPDTRACSQNNLCLVARPGQHAPHWPKYMNACVHECLYIMLIGRAISMHPVPWQRPSVLLLLVPTHVKRRRMLKLKQAFPSASRVVLPSLRFVKVLLLPDVFWGREVELLIQHPRDLEHWCRVAAYVQPGGVSDVRCVGAAAARRARSCHNQSTEANTEPTPEARTQNGSMDRKEFAVFVHRCAPACARCWQPVLVA